MDTLKQNSFLLILLFIVCCNQNPNQTYVGNDCEKYVAAKQGFWLNVKLSKSEDSVKIFHNRNEIMSRIVMNRGSNKLIFIKAPIALKDTIIIINNDSKQYKLYDFTNISEIAIDGLNHKKIKVCRVSTAKIDLEKIKDSDNNILQVELK